MRKICAKSLALLLTVAFCFAAFGAAALAANATATSNLNKRSSPSTSASVITVLKKGASLTVVDGIADGETYNGKKVSGDWYELSDGGFVSADYVSCTEDFFGEEEEPPADEPMGGSSSSDGVTFDDGGDVSLESGSSPTMTFGRFFGHSRRVGHSG